MEYAVFLEGVKDAQELEKAEIALSASRAINATARRARTLSIEQMRRQINFPASYFRGEKSRLQITKKASSGSLEAHITGRDRPTSLARFVTSGTKGKAGVTVALKPGQAKHLPRAFLMPLRSGTDLVNNVGLAIRLPPTKTPDRAYRPLKLASGLWLLYGPSVDQVFKGVTGDITPEVSDYLENEFQRLMDLDI